MSLIKDKRGEMHPAIAGISIIIVGFVLLFIGLYIGYSTISATNVLGTQGTASYTITGNVTEGEWVNITYNYTAAGTTGNVGVYHFEYNTTGSAVCKSTNCILINATYKEPLYTGQNFSAMINANASLASLVTARNSSAGTTILTFDVVGVNSQFIGLTESATNGSWSALNLSTGIIAAPGAVTSETYMSTTFPIMGLALMVVGLFITIGSILGMRGKSGNR